MFKSEVVMLGDVPFPEFIGERVYMRKFYKNRGLPFDLERWQPTVDAMLEKIDTAGPIFLMIDQQVVPAGGYHRRPGLHIDGYWHEGMGHRGHLLYAGEHRGQGEGRHFSKAEMDAAGWETGRWGQVDFTMPEAIVLASNVEGVRAFRGRWEGEVGQGGDCQHVKTDGMKEVIFEPYKTYAGNVSMLHESLPMKVDTPRTVVRLSVPGWSP